MMSYRILPAALLLCTLAAACAESPTGTDMQAQPAGASYDGGGFGMGGGYVADEDGGGFGIGGGAAATEGDAGTSTTTATDSTSTGRSGGGFGIGGGN